MSRKIRNIRMTLVLLIYLALKAFTQYCMYIRRCQLDDILYQIGLNFCNFDLPRDKIV